MRKLSALLLVSVAVLLSPAMASAQAPKAPTEPPQPAPGMADEVINSWNEVGRKLIAMAEDFPEEKYDFKPSPEVRSFAEQLLHIAGGNYLFLKAARGEKWSVADGSPPRENYKTKADVVAFVKKSFADVVAYIREQGDAGMARPMKYPFDNRMIIQSAFWMDVASHPSEHYGQLVVYYRVNGMVPPASRPRR